MLSLRKGRKFLDSFFKISSHTIDSLMMAERLYLCARVVEMNDTLIEESWTEAAVKNFRWQLA